MRKMLIISSIIVICIILSFSYAYFLYHSQQKERQVFNSFFENYEQKIIDGTELATILNKVMNENKTSGKDEIQMDIHIKDNDTTYSAKQIYQLGTERFVSNFNTTQFECKKIEYDSTSGKIQYLFFEQTN